LHEGYLKLLSGKMTARDIIRERVRQEVASANGAQAFHEWLQGLASAVGGRQTKVDSRQAFDNACEAFARSRYVVLVDDYQVEDLDAEITVSAETTVSFLRLVPLVGG
jgi:predicted RNA-binding Zn ribbon-like protein